MCEHSARASRASSAASVAAAGPREQRGLHPLRARREPPRPPPRALPVVVAAEPPCVGAAAAAAAAAVARSAGRLSGRDLARASRAEPWRCVCARWGGRGRGRTPLAAQPLPMHTAAAPLPVPPRGTLGGASCLARGAPCGRLGTARSQACAGAAAGAAEALGAGAVEAPLPLAAPQVRQPSVPRVLTPFPLRLPPSRSACPPLAPRSGPGPRRARAVARVRAV